MRAAAQREPGATDPAPAVSGADALRETLATGAAMSVAGVTVTHARIGDRPVSFVTDKRRDPIQRAHRHGAFYEPEELALIAARFPQGGTFVDIGANVGNHGLYAALFLGAARVIPFEPNPLAYRLLFANVAVNALVDRFVLDHIGVGLSDTEAGGFAMTEREKNLGNARMVAGGGDIAVIRGDTALAGTAPDFIKIDVEGMEMKALGGLRETIGRARPAMLIEVDKTNEADFQTWRARMGYRVAETIKRYVTNRNYLLLPGESGQ